MSGKYHLDETDKAILRKVQSQLPIAERPFQVLGQEMGLGEDELLTRLARLKEVGVVRRIGGNFNSSSLGFASTLCAASVPEDRLDEFVALVNAQPGVTHNYRRGHQFNIWFTFIAEDMDTIQAKLDEITQLTGVPICSLPAEKLFKIQVDFPV